MNKFKIHYASQYNESRNKYCMKTIHFKSKIMLINLQNFKNRIKSMIMISFKQMMIIKHNLRI